jgi:hypothetical protein
MTDRTWVGGHHGDNALSADNWTPAGAPQPGDALTINGGTMNVAGNALAGDTLTASQDNNTQGPIDINASHRAHIDLTLTDAAQVDLSVMGRMSLELRQSFPTMLHTEGGTIRFLSGSEIAGGLANFDSDLTGDTKVGVGGIFGAGSDVSINGHVQSGLVFEINGVARLTLDKPTEFHGEIDLLPNPLPLVDLVGLTPADSWSYRNDMLTIRDSGDHVVDRTHIVSDSSTGGLSLSKMTDGTVQISLGQDFHGTLT